MSRWDRSSYWHRVFEDDGDVPGLGHLGRAEYRKARKPLADHAHRHCMEIVYVGAGRAVWRVGDRDYAMKGGDLFVTFPDEVHGTGPAPESRMNLHWVGVALKGPRTFLGRTRGTALHGALLGIKTRVFKGSPWIPRHLDAAILAIRSGAILAAAEAEARITLALLEVLKCEQAHRNTPPSRLIVPALDHIEANVGEKIRLETLADETGLSLSRFKARFKAETGFAPHDYLMRRKMARACVLLSQSDTPVTQIAMDLAFQNSQHFSTVFKKYHFSTPTAFRNRSRTLPPAEFRRKVEMSG